MASMSTIQARIRSFVMKHWVVLVAVLGIIGVLSAGLLFRIDSLLPGGYSAHEVATYNNAASLKDIWHNPINAPYEIVVHILRSVFPGHLVTVRLTSIFVGWLTILIFFWLLFKWHGLRTALFGTLLFGTSSWFLHTARLGTPDVVLLGLFSIVACGVWLREHRAPGAVLLGLVISSLLLYTPGMVWFLGIGLLWQWSSIDRAFKHNKGSLGIGTLLFLAIVAPLLWHFYQHPAHIADWLCLPDSWAQPLHLLRNIIDVPLAVFVRGQANPETWLGRLPLLTVFSTVMFAIGGYVYMRHAKLARVKLFVLLGILGSIVIGLSDDKISLTVLVPFVYMVVAAGVGYLIEIWFNVFPRNPLARSLGALAVAAVVGITCVYNIRSYFIAWPQADITQALFQREKP